MRFSATILALAASASAAVVPRATADYWLARVSKYEDPNLSPSVTASFKSEASPTIRSLLPSPASSTTRRPLIVLKLSQQGENPNPATVFGEGEVDLEYSEYNKASYGDATVYVSSAVA